MAPGNRNGPCQSTKATYAHVIRRTTAHSPPIVEARNSPKLDQTHRISWPATRVEKQGLDRHESVSLDRPLSLDRIHQVGPSHWDASKESCSSRALIREIMLKHGAS